MFTATCLVSLAVAGDRSDPAGPAWDHFVKITGDTPAARRLFALAGSEGRAEALDLAAADPTTAAVLYAALSARVVRVPRDRAGRQVPLPESALVHEVAPAGPAAAVLVLGTFPDPDGVPDLDPRLFAHHPELTAGPDPEAFRKLFAAWLARRCPPA